jgi:hypothetical protein
VKFVFLQQLIMHPFGTEFIFFNMQFDCVNLIRQQVVTSLGVGFGIFSIFGIENSMICLRV